MNDGFQRSTLLNGAHGEKTVALAALAVFDGNEACEAIIEHFGAGDPTAVNRVSMEQIVAYLDAHPAVFGLNEKYTRGLGWKPALERDKQLGFE